MSAKSRFDEVAQHLLVGSTLPSLLRMVADNRAGIRRWDKVAFLAALSALMAPLRLAERVVAGGRIRRTRIEHPPVFILGVWRSGTTHLHNVLSRDPQFGYVTTLQALFPHLAAVMHPVSRALLSTAGPGTRPMDNMEFGPDLPQEEEPAISNMTPCNGLSVWYFPHRSRELFSRYVTFETASQRDILEWKRACLHTFQTATLVSGGRRIVAKNPWSTARVPQLLDMFPDAKFVHIHRNPYEVYFSAMHGIRTGVRLLAFDDFSEADAERMVIDFYRDIMRGYFAQEPLITAGNLVEVSHHEMLREPDATLRRIYDTLGLPGFEDAHPRFKDYLGTLGGYRQNTYDYDDATLERIRSEWSFTIDRWGYEPPPRSS